MVGKNPKTLNLNPMADDAFTQGGIGGLGSPVYIYGPIPLVMKSSVFITTDATVVFLLRILSLGQFVKILQNMGINVPKSFA